MSTQGPHMSEEDALRIASLLLEQEQVHVLGIKTVFYVPETTFADRELPKLDAYWVVHFEVPRREGAPLLLDDDDVIVVIVDDLTQQASILMRL